MSPLVKHLGLLYHYAFLAINNKHWEADIAQDQALSAFHPEDLLGGIAA